MLGRWITAAGGAALIASAALAAGGVTLKNQVFVETYVTAADGTPERRLTPAATVVPGDRLLYVLSYRNDGTKPAADFVITNPLPPQVQYVSAETAGAEVSVDRGKTWGALSQLKVAKADGTFRAATTADVTHVRWRLAQPIPAGTSGEVAFRGRLK